MAKLNLGTAVNLLGGVKIPLLGLGVYAAEGTTQACLTALKQGYRQIDTAQLYGNEAEVGVGLAAVNGLDCSIFSLPDQSM